MVKKLLLVAAAVCLLVLAVACAPPAEAETIKIGCLLDTTGGLGASGEKLLDGARLAVEDINAAGGVLGKQLELIEEDGATDPATGFDMVKKMVEIDGVQVIAGPIITDSCLRSIPYASEHKIPLITPSATAIPLSEMEGTGWFFRTCLRDDTQGRVLAGIIMDKGYTKLATIVLDNTYGKGLETQIMDQLQAKGWQGEHVISIHYDEAKKDYLTELQQIKDADPDVVFACTYCEDGIIVFKQALDLGLDGIPWLGCDGNYGSGLFEDPKSAEFMEKAFVAGTRTVGTGELYEHFTAAYEDKYGEAPEIYCDTTYDAVWAAAKAIEAAGVYDGEAIRVALTELEFDGVSGPITFDELGDRTAGTFEIWKVVKDPTTPSGYSNVQIETVTWSMEE